MSIIWDCVCTLPDSYGYLKTVRLSLYLIEFFDYQSFQIIFQSDFFLSTSESLLNHGNLYSISHRKNCLKQVFVYDNRQCTFYEHLTVHRVLICNFHDEYTIHLPNGVFINTASFVTLYSKLNISHILFIFSIVSGKSLISFILYFLFILIFVFQ